MHVIILLMRRWRLKRDIWVAIMSSRITADEGQSVTFSSRKASDLPQQQHPDRMRKTAVTRRAFRGKDAQSDPVIGGSDDKRGRGKHIVGDQKR